MHERGLAYDLSGPDLTWTGGGGTWNNGGKFGASAAIVDRTSTMQLDINAVVGNLSLASENRLLVGNVFSLSVNGRGVSGSGSVPNDGTDTLGVAGRASYLSRVRGTVTFSSAGGTGRLTLGPNSGLA